MGEWIKTLTTEQCNVLQKVLTSDALKFLMGAEEWDLSEQDETILWDIIWRAQANASNDVS